jgi:hypothetical protein
MHTLISVIHVCLLVECHARWNANFLTKHKVSTGSKHPYRPIIINTLCDRVPSCGILVVQLVLHNVLPITVASPSTWSLMLSAFPLGLYFWRPFTSGEPLRHHPSSSLAIPHHARLFAWHCATKYGTQARAATMHDM